MDSEKGFCMRCGNPLGLVERILNIEPISIPRKGALCPGCYKNLSELEREFYFTDH